MLKNALWEITIECIVDTNSLQTQAGRESGDIPNRKKQNGASWGKNYYNQNIFLTFWVWFNTKTNSLFTNKTIKSSNHGLFIIFWCVLMLSFSLILFLCISSRCDVIIRLIDAIKKNWMQWEKKQNQLFIFSLSLFHWLSYAFLFYILNTFTFQAHTF